jgi:outer membrane protein assembly factor BamA
MRLRVLAIAAGLAACAPAVAQDTRAAQIEQAREEKARNLQPDEVSGAERALRRVKDEKILERIAAGYNGFRAKIGNMATGGGFALGPEYYREELFDGALTARAAAQISTRAYQKLETQWTLPRLAGNRAWIDFYAAHRNYNSINYYGPGPDSAKGARSNYRLEDTFGDAVVGVRPARWLNAGGSAGYLWMNVGPGQDERFVSSERIFSPSAAPGIDRQTDFLRYGGFVQADYRDNRLGPKSGGNYIVQWTKYDDRDLGLHEFRRLDVNLEQYLPMFNKTRVIALRARTSLTDSDAGQRIPFYLQPLVGGSDDLRGFRPFRFSGRNSLVLNAEYRWEAFAGMDAAIFADAGKVFERRGQLNFANLEGSAGFGFRFNVRNQTFLRLDAGFSHEGFQVWFKFNDLFGQFLPGTASTQPIL